MKAIGMRVGFLLTFCIVVPYSLISSADARTPTEYVKLAIDNVIKILTDEELRKPENTQERRTAMRKIVDHEFDFEEMAKRSLARHWRRRTPEERKEFVSLYSDLLWKAYINIVEKYENGKIEFLGETIRSKYAVVKTKIIAKKSTVISIDFRLLKRKVRWMTYDVNIQGVSLINNYRAQFNAIIRSGSYEELIERIKNKLVSEVKIE